MKIFKLPLAGLLFCTAPLLAGCGTSDKPEAPVSLTWEMGTGNAEPGYYENSFVLKNISVAPLPRNWTIYYSQLPRNVKQIGNPAVKVEPVNGNFFKMYPTESFTPLAPGDSMRITFLCSYTATHRGQMRNSTPAEVAKSPCGRAVWACAPLSHLKS